MIKLFLLLIMIFCHIADDFYMQGLLINFKQRNFWKKNAPEKLYRYDYLMALVIHCFSWSFMVMITPMIYNITCGPSGTPVPTLVWTSLFAANMIIHGITDNAKANKRTINLIQDQSIHIVQVVLTWLVLIGV